MPVLEILLIALSLAMDCFAVSVTCGAQPYIKRRTAFRMATLFGLFQGGLLGLGILLGRVFKNAAAMAYIDHWMAFGLLLVIGLKMCIDALKPHDESREFRVDHWIIILGLSLATSIDAFVVGIGLGLGADRLWLTAILVAVVSFVMTGIGFYFGRRARFVTPRAATFIGGAILVGIGVKILIEHTCL